MRRQQYNPEVVINNYLDRQGGHARMEAMLLDIGSGEKIGQAIGEMMRGRRIIVDTVNGTTYVSRPHANVLRVALGIYLNMDGNGKGSLS